MDSDNLNINEANNEFKNFNNTHYSYESEEELKIKQTHQDKRDSSGLYATLKNDAHDIKKTSIIEIDEIPINSNNSQGKTFEELLEQELNKNPTVKHNKNKINKIEKVSKNINISIP